MELSIVMPCLDEAETIAGCVRAARGFIERHGLSAEIVVGDNGSTDGSPEMAALLGARVVHVPRRGYGSALLGAVAAARGRYVIMADADGSYDFGDLLPFVERLRAGCDLVMGDRIGGTILPGAMPWLNRWVGNPILSGVGRLFFRSPVRDFHCGLRAFSKAAFERMDLHTPGMEFASEMVVKASLQGMRIAEVPITFRRDGRSRPPHLRRWRDGWRHLRFMLLFSPTWLFLVPGLLLFVVGALGSAALVPGPLHVGSVTFDIHTLLMAGFACITGLQLVVFALFSRAFAVAEGLLPPSRWLSSVLRYVNLERGILLGLVALLAGFGLLGVALAQWSGTQFGDLEPTRTMRLMIPAVVLATLGVQIVFSSFFLSVLTLRRS